MNANTHLIHAIADALIHAHGEDATDWLEGGGRTALAHRDHRGHWIDWTLYSASGCTHVGTTQGRGRYDRHTRRDQPKKDLWLRPLREDWRRTLNR